MEYNTLEILNVKVLIINFYNLSHDLKRIKDISLSKKEM